MGAKRRPRRLCHSPFPMADSTTTAMATPATLSTTMARGLLTPSLLLMLMLILSLPTDTTATAMDSTGHTDSAGTTVDTSEDTGPTDIPTGDKEIAAIFLSYGYRADTTQMCSESQSQNVE